MRDISKLFQALASSAFRSRFHLASTDRDYIHRKGMPAVLTHAHEFVVKKLAPAEPHNDGKQTPWKGHPVFIAQHATATCCRGCLAKWHLIPKGRQLTAEETEYVVLVIDRWLRLEVTPGTDRVERMGDLFENTNTNQK